MNKALGCALIAAALTLGRGAVALAAEPAPPAAQVQAAIDRLVAAVDRLAALIEQGRAEEREERRVQNAVGILMLRQRKIERLEGEIQGIGREIEQIEQRATLMKGQLEQMEAETRAEGGSIAEGPRREIAALELQLKLDQERAARIEGRRALLQGDLAAEQRRVANLEEILETWTERP
jgi:chromosome segregation ATPase